MTLCSTLGQFIERAVLAVETVERVKQRVLRVFAGVGGRVPY